jgi:hypothetical protein
MCGLVFLGGCLLVILCPLSIVVGGLLVLFMVLVVVVICIVFRVCTWLVCVYSVFVVSVFCVIFGEYCVSSAVSFGCICRGRCLLI